MTATNAIPIVEFERSRSSKKKPRFNLTNTSDLMLLEFDPVKWIVPGYVSEGFSVLAGRQKLGKTWLAIDMAIAVATGGAAMSSISCDQGDVLYIDMENGSRRIQSRISMLFPNKRTMPNLSSLDWVTDAPQLDKGFIDALEDWRSTTKNPRLVVIDVLQRIKPPAKNTGTSYEQDYSVWAPLQKWATDHGIAVIGLHHTKKGGAEDPLEALSGSNGLSACADATLVLDRTSNGITLYVRGRDVEEKEAALNFSGGFWTLQGDAATVRRTDERSIILEALRDADSLMSPTDLSDATRMSNQNIRQMLVTMAKAGEVTKVRRGRYAHPDRADLIAAKGADHNNHKVTYGDDEGEE